METRIPSMYLPPISVFVYHIQKQVIKIDLSGRYTKGSFRNTALIAGPNGIQSLIVPVVKNNNDIMSEVVISNDEDWRRIHLRSIETAYGTAPYYEYYIQDLVEVYQKDFTYLWELNLALLNLFIHKLQLSIMSKVQNDLLNNESNNQRLSKHILFDEKISHRKQVELKPYPQVFEYKYGWQNDLSILDLLMCLGPMGKAYLEEQEIGIN